MGRGAPNTNLGFLGFPHRAEQPGWKRTCTGSLDHASFCTSYVHFVQGSEAGAGEEEKVEGRGRV